MSRRSGRRSAATAAAAASSPGTASAVGVDIGGTKVLAGAVDATGQVIEKVLLDTPGRTQEPSVVESVIVRAVTELASRVPVGNGVGMVGIGAAGFVDESRSTIRFSPHLSWRDEPVKARLEAELGLPVVIDNDANTTALAEVRFGAGRGAGVVLVVTLGTGIGGALVVGDQLFRGANGMAGEFGHMRWVPDGHRCECGNEGCWEQYASGNALVRESRSLVAAHSPSAAALRDACGDDPDALTGPMVSRVAEAGDRTAQELLFDVGTHLGAGLASLCAALDPDRIVIGGGVSAAGDLLLDPAKDALERGLTGRGFRPTPEIVPAALGADAGFIGAAEMARQDLRMRSPQRVLVRLRARVGGLSAERAADRAAARAKRQRR